MQKALFKLLDAMELGRESKSKEKNIFKKKKRFVRQYFTVWKKKRNPIKRSQMLKYQRVVASLVTRVQ